MSLSETLSERIEPALDFLRDNARDAAKARAELRYLAEFLKAKKAILKANVPHGTSNAAAEDIALSSPEYLSLLEAYKSAVLQDSYYAFKRAAAEATVAAWQTECANHRSENKAYG